MSGIEIAVVGSINIDISVVVGSLPLPGETVMGSDALWSGGGKGANQAVGAARLGRRVAMVGAVGSDAIGADLVGQLEAESIDVSEVAILDDVSTGLAMIVVDSGAENSIVVSPGANAMVTPDSVRSSVVLADAKLVMVQFEIPSETVEALAQIAEGRLVVNPAPARPVSEALLGAARIIVPNRGELSAIVGAGEAAGLDELADQARSIETDGAVVVTLGSEGAMVVEAGEVLLVPSVEVEAVDTTAAGDSFCASLADALVDGTSMEEAVHWAVKVASVTVSRRGAQDSLPTLQRLGSDPNRRA